MAVSARQLPAQQESVRSEPPPIWAVVDFESFYRAEYRPVGGLAYALSSSLIAAEDIAQDAFPATHKQWARVAFYNEPEAWVRRMFSNPSVSFFRTRLREAGAVGEPGDGHQSLRVGIHDG